MACQVIEREKVGSQERATVRVVDHEAEIARLTAERDEAIDLAARYMGGDAYHEDPEWWRLTARQNAAALRSRQDKLATTGA